jgi:ribosomal protein S18 acetylase RimI-like enzyme
MSEHRIRRATAADAEDFSRLLRDFQAEFSEPAPEQDVLARRSAEYIETGEITVLLGGEGPDALAELRFRKSVLTGGLDAYLEELYVAPAKRGHGLGRAMLEAAMDTAREEGATHIDLGTSDDDVAARALYESAGFTNREGRPDGPIMYFYEREL